MSTSYIVTATLPDPQTAVEYLRWLAEGHAQDVLAAGAMHAHVVRVDEPSSPIQVIVWYAFASRESLERYLVERAPALRREGMERFGDRGIVFSRQIGEVVADLRGAAHPTAKPSQNS